MSFHVILQTNASEENKLDKDVTNIIDLEGVLRDQSSIINPSILVTLASIPAACNYMTIAEFGRKYFVTDIVSVRNGVYQITGRVDVLSSFATQIRTCKGIIKRSENDWNTYLNDGSFKTYQVPQTVCKEFTTGFSTTPQYVLTVI